MRVLIIAEHPKLARAMQQALEEDGISVQVVPSIADAEQLVTIMGFDLLILDLGWPKEHGLHFLTNLRGNGIHIRTLALTVRNPIFERDAGYPPQADATLTMPFTLEDLLEKVRFLGNSPPQHATASSVYHSLMAS